MSRRCGSRDAVQGSMPCSWGCHGCGIPPCGCSAPWVDGGGTFWCMDGAETGAGSSFCSSLSKRMYDPPWFLAKMTVGSSGCLSRSGISKIPESMPAGALGLAAGLCFIPKGFMVCWKKAILGAARPHWCAPEEPERGDFGAAQSQGCL